MKLNKNIDKESIVAKMDEDFWYNLTKGGYLDPEELLESKDDVLKVKNAISVLESFESVLEELVAELEDQDKDNDEEE